MELQGRVAELMARVDPSLHRKYISSDDKKMSILYVRLHKAIYGLLKSALLFYQKLRGQLEGNSFKVDPYDPCIANKWVGGGQLTLKWHVDNLKVSHENPQCVTDLIKWLSSLYGELKIEGVAGKSAQLSGNHPGLPDGRGGASVNGGLHKGNNQRLSRGNHWGSSKSSWQPLVSSEAANEVVKLPEEQAVHFHHTESQLLFASTRARRDIQVAVAFLTPWAKDPDDDDWGKLK